MAYTGNAMKQASLFQRALSRPLLLRVERSRQATRRAYRSSGAFTLVELLVVIAIIAILAGLLLPALASGKASAASAVCKRNLKQLSLAQALFVEDVGAFPFSFMNPKNIEAYVAEGHRFSWPMAIEPYLSKQQIEMEPSGRRGRVAPGVWRCPGVMPRDAAMDIGFHGPGIVYAYYGQNTVGLDRNSVSDELLGLGGTGVKMDAVPTKESEIIAPSIMIGVGDGLLGARGKIADGIAGIAHNVLILGPENTKRAQRRHKGRANIAAVDAHAESLKLKDLFSDTEPSTLRRWNKDNESHAERIR